MQLELLSGQACGLNAMYWNPRWSKLFPFSPLLLSLLLLIFCCGVVFADDPITSSDLPNGLRIIVAPKHTAALAAIDVWVRAGTRRQAPGQEGVAHYLEHVLFKGTPSRPTETDVDGAIEDLGGTLDAATSYDWAHFYTLVPSDSFEAALDVVADTLQHSNISQASVDSERPVILNEIERSDDDATSTAEQHVREAIFGGDSPYGKSIMGTEDQVNAVQRDQIVSFYHEFYVPSNVAIVVAGDVTPERVQKAVAASFGGWKGDPAPPESALATPMIKGVTRQVINSATSQSNLVVGWTAPSVSDQPNVWAMDILLTYLGQGAVSVLDDDLHRTNHYATAVTADFLTQRDTGLLTVTCTFPSGNLEQIKPVILQHISALRNRPLTEAELAGAKQQLISSYLFDTETDSGKADALGFYEMIDTYRYDADYVDHVNSVTPDEIQAVAQKYLFTDAYVQTLVEPPNDPSDASSIEPPGPGTNQIVLARLLNFTNR